jgi:hypothetical protein
MARPMVATLVALIVWALACTKPHAAGKIFLSYRRDDDPGNTGRLFDRLQEAFKPGCLFMDVENVGPGLDFVRVLQEQVTQCDVLLVVIGKKWIAASDATGARRLDNPEDFVRIEIESALKQNKRVVPVLVGEARMPCPKELPRSIRLLARRNAIRLTHERFHTDVQGLIEALQRAFKEVEADRQTQAKASRQKHQFVNLMIPTDRLPKVIAVVLCVALAVGMISAWPLGILHIGLSAT